MKQIAIFLISFTLIACSSTSKVKETFTVNLKSPQIMIGRIEVTVDKFFGIGIKKTEFDVVYFPNEDVVCIRTESYMLSYDQYWNKEGRESFIEALRLYNEDFEQQRLISSNRKTRKFYGAVDTFFAWKTNKFGDYATGNTINQLGYYIIGKSPFFATTQLEVEYIDATSRTFNKTSPVLQHYFTRAQAENLAVIFSQEYIQNAIQNPLTQSYGGIQYR
jgi:hypothetical protein